MKLIITILLTIPILSFGQVKLDDLIKKNGLSYEKNQTAPFSGKAYAYLPNGDTRTIIEYKDGLPNGEIKSWSKKDVKEVEGFVENGKRTGTWNLYYPNGQLKKQSTYQNDKENGEEIFWYENGKIHKKGNYQNGQLNGKYEWYFPSGQKQQEGYFVNGKEDSTWRDWHENGKMKMEGHFKNLKKNGSWTWWDENGQITTQKNYENDLVKVDKDNFESYIEKMEYFLQHRNFKESVKNVELAESTITDKSESNSIYMGLVIFRSRCYSYFSHYKEGEKVLLDAIGFSENQAKVIQSSHMEKSPEKIKKVIKEISDKDKSKFSISNHVALGLCYNILGDTIQLKNEQQVMMDSSRMKDWVIEYSFELYKLAAERLNTMNILNSIEEAIHKNGLTENLEIEKAQVLVRAERFEEARKIADKYLKENEKNLKALMLEADIEMAYGNVEKMKVYEDRAIAIDPKAFISQPK